MAGATFVPRSLKTKRNKKNFKIGKNFYFLNHIWSFYSIFSNNIFSKIRSINSDREGCMCQSWAKMSNFIPLSLRLSGIECLF
jgi:hypothetical protein